MYIFETIVFSLTQTIALVDFIQVLNGFNHIVHKEAGL